jgi:menaquinone-dependent protoporphyrinogen IX oxidase
MERTVVIYKSKHGSTEKYARWIGEELNCPVVAARDFSKKDFDKYDNIIFGGCVHGGGIEGFDLIRKNMRLLRDKKIVTFAVGLNVMQTENRMQLRDINFHKKSVKGMTCYYCPGAYNPDEVKGIDAFIIKITVRLVESKKPDEITEDDKKLLMAVKEGADFTDKKYIAPIVAEFK